MHEFNVVFKIKIFFNWELPKKMSLILKSKIASEKGQAHEMWQKEKDEVLYERYKKK